MACMVSGTCLLLLLVPLPLMLPDPATVTGNCTWITSGSGRHTVNQVHDDARESSDIPAEEVASLPSQFEAPSVADEYVRRNC